MMIGPQLQKAIYAALTADPALCDGRVFDRVPEGAGFPYLTIGDEQVVDAGNSCAEGWELYPDIHIWTRPAAGSKLEGKALVAEAVERLLAIATVDGFTVISARLETARAFRDPDGLTEHGVVTLRFLLDPA